MIKCSTGGAYYARGEWVPADGEASAALAAKGFDAAAIENAKTGTMAYSILQAHNTSGDAENLKIKFDAMASHDITFVGIIQTARASGLEKFPIPYVLTNCHNSLCAVGGTINEDDHRFGLSAAKKYGGIFVPPHLAVIHQYMREKFAGCGKMILGSDSHTRYGALGTMAIGEGGGELAKQLLGGAVGVGCAALCVLFACVGLSQLAENAFFIYSLSSAVTVAADVAQYGLLSLAFGKLSQLGFRLLERVKNFRRYRDIINLQEACPLADIARASGRSVAVVEKDLKDLVRRGYFPFGFVDDETGCFWANNAVWRLKNPQRAKQQDEQARAKPRRKKAKKPAAAQPQSAFAAQSQNFLRELDAQIKEIDDEEIAKSARGIREKAQDIFEWVQSHPGAQDDVRRFCDYYMPTTLRLLKVYNEVEPHTASSEAAANVRNEVRDVLAPVNDAFANLLDSLLQAAALDVSAEAGALKAVLSQEGLVEGGLAMHAAPKTEEKER